MKATYIIMNLKQPPKIKKNNTITDIPFGGAQSSKIAAKQQG